MVVTVPELAVVVPCYNERENIGPLVAALDRALEGIVWEVIFVDDDSPDDTIAEIRRLAREDNRVRGLKRIGRRGLASAVVEGALSTSADYIGVIDGDLQHDETKLPLMLASLRACEADIVVGSRHLEGASTAGLVSAARRRISAWGASAARLFLPLPLADPMSGFFMLSRARFEALAPQLSAQGFKILLDVVLTAGRELKVKEIPYHFRPRRKGESKLDILVLAQFAALLLDKALGGLVPLRFVSFALVGGVGVLVNLAVMEAAHRVGLGFDHAQALGTIIAIIANFQLNNVLTYRSVRLKGAQMWRGLILFMLVCGLGAIANIGIATLLYVGQAAALAAGAAGAVIGVVWNYAVSTTLVWRAR